MSDPAEIALRRGIAAGLLPADAKLPAQEQRPWPVVLLTALGAWLAALPLLGFFGLLLGAFMTQSFGAYLVGALALAGAAYVLRSGTLPVFVEQLVFPALLVGAGSLAFALYRDLPHPAASLALLATCAALVAVLRKAWLRILLGALAAGLFVALVLDDDSFRGTRAPMFSLWIALQAALWAWAAAAWLQHQGRLSARFASAVEPAGAGWLVAVFAGLCGWSGMTFLVGGSLGFWGQLAGELSPRLRGGSAWLVMQAGSAAFAALAAVLAARAWPGLRQLRLAGVALVLVGLAAALPALGGVLLALAIAATSGRWRLAGAAGLAAAWIVGSFYYQLQWPLVHKALLLVAAGAVLALLAWLGRESPTRSAVSAPASRLQPALVGLAAVATVAVANFAIWQKEDLIANGRKVYVQLAPVDPRSLMQGDFMRLNWALPGGERDLEGLLAARRPHVIARLDARGVAQLQRVDSAAGPLAPGEIRIELTPRGGRWMIVTDAWFFREGDGARWERARFGEFRVLPDGRALLVGLADAQLQPITP